MNGLQAEIEKKYQNAVLPGNSINIQTKPYSDNLHRNGECYEVTISFLSTRIEYVRRDQRTGREEVVPFDPNDKNIEKRNKYVSYTEFWRRYESGAWGCTRDGND